MDPIENNRSIALGDGGRPQTELATVGVALVHWNSGPVTVVCIQSLVREGIDESNICVVDNGSTEEIEPELRQRWPLLKVIRNPSNRGFAAAQNQAAAYLRDQDCEYVWILNNDTEIQPDSARILMAALSQRPRAAAVSAKILFPGGKHVWFAGASLNRFLFLPSHEHKGAEVTTLESQCASRVPFLSGCCLLVRGVALDEIGGLDELLFAYCEDTDWCLRAQVNGWELWYVPDAVIWHHEAVSMSRNRVRNSQGTSSPISIYLINRNRLWIIRKHCKHWWWRTPAIGVLIARSLPYAAAYGLLGRWNKLSALMRGIGDGVFAPSGNKH